MSGVSTTPIRMWWLTSKASAHGWNAREGFGVRTSTALQGEDDESALDLYSLSDGFKRDCAIPQRTSSAQNNHLAYRGRRGDSAPPEPRLCDFGALAGGDQFGSHREPSELQGGTLRV